ncbi:MAG: methionine adenosyltransferase domain-containing protein, partial [Phycisphaerae bacterium]|nr:methionine adenosyltransferase domain-containing protein [Phycisphaerae bacterium]
DEGVIEQAVLDLFDLTPQGIIKHLKLRRPIYSDTAHDGHFGRKGRGFTWEKTDMAKKLKEACGL